MITNPILLSQEFPASENQGTLRLAMLVSTWIWLGMLWFYWHSVEAIWHGFQLAGIHIKCAKTSILKLQVDVPLGWRG